MIDSFLPENEMTRQAYPRRDSSRFSLRLS